MSTTPTREALTWISQFKHTRGYTFMCSTSHLYIHARHFLPFLFEIKKKKMAISLKGQNTKTAQTCEQLTRSFTVACLSLHLPVPHTVCELIYYTRPAITQMASWGRDRKCRQLCNLFLIWLCWGSSAASCSDGLETDSIQGPPRNHMFDRLVMINGEAVSSGPN